MNSLCRNWSHGALARDSMPASASIRWKVTKKPIPSRKAHVLKRTIRACMIEERKKEKQELEKQLKEAEAKGLTIKEIEEKDNVDLKIATHEDKLEGLQKEKHKLFLVLKKVLQNEKKKESPPTQPAPPAFRKGDVMKPPGQSPTRFRMMDDRQAQFGNRMNPAGPRMYNNSNNNNSSGNNGNVAGGGYGAPSMLQQFSGYNAQPARPSMLHSGRDFGGPFRGRGRGGRGGGGRGRGFGQGPSWRNQDVAKRGRGGFRKDYYNTPTRM